jgi:hypothetical protein
VPDLNSIGILLAKAAMKLALESAMGDGTKGLIAAIKNIATESNVELNEQDSKMLQGTLEGTNVFFQAIFTMLRLKSAGMISVGPSGSGKTSIQNFFAKDQLTPSSESTYRTASASIPYGAWMYQVTDTPGQHLFAEARGEAIQAIENSSAKVLMLVFAGGFLKTVGIEDATGHEMKYKRPDRDPQPNLTNYLSLAIDEEIDWLEKFKKEVPSHQGTKFKYAMVVVNKLDQWFSISKQITKFYEGKLTQIDDQSNTDNLSKHLTSTRSQRFMNALTEIINAWCVQSIKPSFHYVSSQYDSFYGNPPSGDMSVAAAESSVRILRAQVRLRFLEG